LYSPGVIIPCRTISNAWKRTEYRDWPVIREVHSVFALKEWYNPFHLNESHIETPPESTVKKMGQGAQDFTSHHLDDLQRDPIPPYTVSQVQGPTSYLHFQTCCQPPEEGSLYPVIYVIQKGPLSLVILTASFGSTCPSETPSCRLFFVPPPSTSLRHPNIS
jgi:hypothetical protein